MQKRNHRKPANDYEWDDEIKPRPEGSPIIVGLICIVIFLTLLAGWEFWGHMYD